MNANLVSWVHFGDLQITNQEARSYCDLKKAIEEVNQHLSNAIDFAYFPGDNAHSGEEHEYQLAQSALSRLTVPACIIPGDHDNLDHYKKYLSGDPYRSFDLSGYHFCLLNSVARREPSEFGLGLEQLAWLCEDVRSAYLRGLRTVLFAHAYPREHGEDASTLRSLIEKYHVLLVDMGHTRRNEIANDGSTIYTTTRSIGQNLEGPAGYSVIAIHNDNVSWKFKEIGSWPFVMIASPVDCRLAISWPPPARQSETENTVRALVFSPAAIQTVLLQVDTAPPVPMTASQTPGIWEAQISTDSANHLLRVTASAEDRSQAVDVITFGKQVCRCRSHLIDNECVVGLWPEKGIVGNQLRPKQERPALAAKIAEKRSSLVGSR